MMRDARSTYFANLISANKRNSKFLFETINTIVSHTAPQVPVLSNADCNNFLKCFVDKVSDIRANILPSSIHHTTGVSCSTILNSFSPVSLEDTLHYCTKLSLHLAPLTFFPHPCF